MREFRSVSAPTLGRCRHCGKRRQLPKQLNYARLADFQRDEFCSTECCRAANKVSEHLGTTARAAHLYEPSEVQA